MALNADEGQSRAQWSSRGEGRLTPGGALLLTLASSVVLWVLFILMGRELLRLAGYP
jgi:hypothetical protein